MPGKSPRDQLLEQFASVAKAMSNPHRLDLLEYLGQGERSVDALSKLVGLSVANASQHLQYLRRAGLVTSQKRGLYVFYSLSGDDVIDLFTALRLTTERHTAEVDRIVSGYFTERDGLEAVSRNELLTRTKEGLVTVLDVRPADEYETGHLPGAVNIPLTELEKRLDELPKELEVIAYCRGPYCFLVFEAVAELRKKSFKARRLEDGYPEWKAAGLPIETGPSFT